MEFPQDEGSHSPQASTRMEWWYGFFRVVGETTIKGYTIILALFYEMYTTKLTNVRFLHVTHLVEQ